MEKEKYFHITNYGDNNITGFIAKTEDMDNFKYVFGEKTGNKANEEKFSELKVIFYLNDYGLPVDISVPNFNMESIKYITIENSLGLHFYIKSDLSQKLKSTHEELLKNTESDVNLKKTTSEYTWDGITVDGDFSVVMKLKQNTDNRYHLTHSSQQVNV